MITVSSFAIILGSGLLAGFLTGLVSLGGAFIVVPAIYHALTGIGVSSHSAFTTAVATSIAFVLISSSSAASSYAKKSMIDYRLVIILSLGAVTGVWIGVQTLMQADDHFVRRMFGIFIWVMGAYMAASKYFKWGQNNTGDQTSQTIINQAAIFVIGGIVGFLVSVFGIGGGGVIAPAIALIARAQMKRAIATGVAATVVISLYGALSYMVAGWENGSTVSPSIGWIYLPALLLLIPCALISAPLGAKVAMKLPQPTLISILIVTMFVMGWTLIGL